MTWWERAACAGADVNMFHSESGHGASVVIEQFCNHCPVVQECLRDALRVEQPSHRQGVWGGMSKHEREVVFDGRKPPRPARTHCPAGHELTDDNLINGGRARRKCKTCHDETQRVMYYNRTHCKNGHELTVENVVIRRGGRRCLACERARLIRHRKSLERVS